MVATRKTPAPSNMPGEINGAAYAEAVNAEIQALWDNSFMQLVDVAGTANAITAKCPVPLDADKAGQKFVLVPTLANTATAITLKIDNKTAKPLIDRDAQLPAVGRLQVGVAELLVDQGSNYRLLNDKQQVNAAPKITSFGYQLAYEVRAISAPNGWSNFPLNSVRLSEILGCSLDTATGIFTAAPGVYDLEAECYGYNTAFGLFLYNVTAGGLVTTGISRTQGRFGSIARLSGRINLSITTQLQLRVWCSGAADLGFEIGVNSPTQQPEHYGFITIKSYN
jgi:hypothetical protein